MSEIILNVFILLGATASGVALAVASLWLFEKLSVVIKKRSKEK